MSITLDSVLTVAIGRNGRDGTPMSDRDWAEFQSLVAAELVSAGGTIVAHTTGGGLGSDGVNEGSEEESAVFVAINIEHLIAARRSIALALKLFGQSSAAFAFDMAHEPVFPTPTGFRPQDIDSFGALLAEGNGRRTMRQ
jgi:hypothetical protein